MILAPFNGFFVLQPSLSTEELNAEMRNLEGLMKDLSSINKATKSHNLNNQHYQC